MNTKNWSRRGLVLALTLAVSLLLLRSWTPSGGAPGKSSPQPNPSQQEASSQKQIHNATAQPPISGPDANTVLTTAPTSQRRAKSPLSELQATDFQDLIGDTEDPDWTIRWDAVNELGKLRDKRAVSALARRVLYDDNNHPRWRSLWALKAVDRRGSEAIPLLRDALSDALSYADEAVARNAAVGLAFFGQPEGRAELLRGLGDQDSFRRWEAIYSLRKIGNHEVAEEMVLLLGEDMEPETRVRSEVALTLGYMRSRDLVAPLMNSLKTDTSPQVRWRAAMALSKLGNSTIVEELEEIMGTEQDPQVQKHVQVALSRVRNR